MPDHASATRMHADEIEIDAPLVSRLVATQFPEWAGLAIEPVYPRGTDNAIYRLGATMAVRLPRRQRTTGPLEKERQWLATLAPLLPLAIPTPLAEGMPGDGYPWHWSVYRWLEGQPASPERVGDPSQLAVDLARLVQALQRIRIAGGPPPGADNFFRGVPLAMRDEATRAAIASLADTIDVDAATAEWDAALRAPMWRDSPVWLHGDLDARNLLVTDGRLSGVVDFGCLGVGDPACDVMVAWKMLSPQTRDVFRERLSVDDATWARSRGWALSQALMALGYYTPDNNLVLVEEARRWMTALLADPA